METGEIIAVAAILLAIFALMWQINAQRGRLEDKIDRQGDRLEAKIDREVGRLEAEIEKRSDKLGAEIGRVETRMEGMSQRVSDSELEQARLNGVNSVLTGQTHTHEDR